MDVAHNRPARQATPPGRGLQVPDRPGSQAPPAPDPTAATGSEPPVDASVGHLLSEITEDVTGLVRDEINLAKAELKEEVVTAGKAGGMLAGAGYAGHLLVLFLSLTVMFALAHVVDTAWAALIVTALWAAAAAALYFRGRKGLKQVHLKPEQTVETLEEDAKWARHPTS